MSKVFGLLIYYSYLFVLFKIIESEVIKYYRLNKGKYKKVEGVVTNISSRYRTINIRNKISKSFFFPRSWQVLNSNSFS